MLKYWAKTFGGIVISAMLQPDNEIIESYDNLILLEKGGIIYFGPPINAINYFNNINYIIPKDKDIGSFLSQITTSKFRKELNQSNEYKDTDKIKKLYNDSELNKTTLESIKESKNKKIDLFTTPYSKKVYNNNYSLNWFDMFKIVFIRQCKLFIRDKVYLIGRIMQCIVMGIIIGLVFGKV